jgi:enamine deaminase RidA (YjgF/YER057c/UK114 family)
VRVGPHVAVAGTTGAGSAGDIAAQTRDALRRIEIALRQAGAALTDVVRTAATLVEVSALIAPDSVVEIEADAYVAPQNVPSAAGG